MTNPLVIGARIMFGATAKDLAKGEVIQLADTIGDLAEKGFAAAVAFEQLELQLATVTGSAQSAQAVFDHIKELARTTPLEIEGLVASFVDLQQAGIAPTDELLKSLGNIASGFGRDISDVSTAVVRALGGQAGALEEFGIRFQAIGETVRITVGDQVREVENSAAAITAALQSIGESDFAGAMEREANSFTGAVDDLVTASKDLADSIVRESGFLGLATSVVQGATQVVGSARRTVDPTLEEKIAQAEEGIEGLEGRLLAQANSLGNFLASLEEGQLGTSQIFEFQEAMLTIQEGIDGLEEELARLIALRPQTESTLENAFANVPSSGDLDRPVFGGSPSPTPSVRQNSQQAGLSIVEPSLCECIASLIESNRSPFAAASISAMPSQIDGPEQSGVPGTDAPVSPEAVDTLIAAEDAACDYAESIQKIDEDTRRAQEVSQLFGNAASTAMAQIRDGSFSAADALDSLLDRLFQLLVINPFEQALTGFVEGLLTPTGSAEAIQSDFFGPTATGAIVAHTGGIVGASDLPTRLVSASVAGVAADEFPAVLRRGEGVFTPQQMAALAPAGGGGDVTVNVIDRRSGDSAPVEVTERQTNGRREIEVLIVDTVARDIGRRGSVGQAIESTFGARRQGVR